MKYVVDGSFKGMILGAGVVAVNEKKELELHSFTGYHIHGDSLMAEAFAVNSAIRLILSARKQQKNIAIYIDNTSIVSMLNGKTEIKNDYVYNVKKQVEILKKYANLSIGSIDSSIKAYAKQAHNLSRAYLKNAVAVQLASPSNKIEVIR